MQNSSGYWNSLKKNKTIVEKNIKAREEAFFFYSSVSIRVQISLLVHGCSSPALLGPWSMPTAPVPCGCSLQCRRKEGHVFMEEREEVNLLLKKSELRASRKQQIHCLSLVKFARKAQELFFFYSCNQVLCRVAPLPWQLAENAARCLLLDVCSYFHQVLNLNLVRSGRGTQPVLEFGGFFLHPPHWYFWSPAYNSPTKQLLTPLERMQGAEKKNVIKRPICLYLYLNPGWSTSVRLCKVP